MGLLLGVVAVVLINQNRRYLTGMESNERLRDAAVAKVKAMPQVDKVSYLRLEYVGPRQVLLMTRSTSPATSRSPTWRGRSATSRRRSSRTPRSRRP